MTFTADRATRLAEIRSGDPEQADLAPLVAAQTVLATELKWPQPLLRYRGRQITRRAANRIFAAYRDAAGLAGDVRTAHAAAHVRDHIAGARD